VPEDAAALVEEGEDVEEGGEFAVRIARLSNVYVISPHRDRTGPTLMWRRYSTLLWGLVVRYVAEWDCHCGPRLSNEQERRIEEMF